MADIFRKEDACCLLKKKVIYMFGDSNMRSFYLDMVYLLKEGGIAPAHVFRRGGPGKSSYYGDKLVDMSKNSICGRNYFEIRQYQDDNVILRYCFITRVYSSLVQRELNDIAKGGLPIPDVVIVNSCLWDTTRWGAMREDKYKQEMVDLIHHLQRLLPDDTLIIWTTTLPVSSEKIKGGVFIEQLQFMKHSMRFMIMEANKFAQQVCIAFDVDLLDLHYHMRFQLHRRTNDGLHWEPPALRHITNLILTHIALCWEKPLPGNFIGSYVRSAISCITEGTLNDKEDVQLDQEVQQYVQKKLQEEKIIKVVRISPQKVANDQAKDKKINKPGKKAIARKLRLAPRKRKPFNVWNEKVNDKRAKVSGSVAPSFHGGCRETNKQQDNSVIGLREICEDQREFGYMSGRDVAQFGHNGAQSTHDGAQFGHDGALYDHKGAEYGRDIAHSGQNMAQSGRDVAFHYTNRDGHDMAHSSHNMPQSGHDRAQSVSDLALYYSNRIQEQLESQNHANHWTGGSMPSMHYSNVHREEYENNMYQQGQGIPNLMGDCSNQNMFRPNNPMYVNPHYQSQDRQQQAAVMEWPYQQQHIQAPQNFWKDYPTSDFPWNWRR